MILLPAMLKNTPELQDVFIEHSKAYLNNHVLYPWQLKAMYAISNCRTANLGGHLDRCDHCDYLHISYNSCRNRNCPKCQTLSKERWIEARKEDLLDTGYFHIVFTIPDSINPLAYQNPQIIYDILFKAAAETLKELAADKKYLGAEIGFSQVLHTWGQNLMHHPHIHCIIPGGGLSPAGRWINSRKKFFIPVKVIAKKFKGKFLYYLKKAPLEFYGSLEILRKGSDLQLFYSSLYQKKWVVYCKAPFKNAGYVVEYLGRYTHRVAISNNRILKLENGSVTFKWRDYRDNNKQKIMTLSAEEFIRRFLIHVLPTGFTKIRHYGFLSPRNKSTKLLLCKKLTFTAIPVSPKGKKSFVELILKLTGKDITICPRCGIGHLSRASPLELVVA